jgi:methylmalonyl-CoA/ethylmalonyl-CoA epimerase
MVSAMIRGIHHVNLLVRDLDVAVERYTRLLGIKEFVFDSLSSRAVRTARFRAGDSWIVLVQPTGPGEPQRVLDEEGEGLFLLSFDVSHLADASEAILAADGQLSGPPRIGLDGWSVVDLDRAALCGGRIQLTEDSSTT